MKRLLVCATVLGLSASGAYACSFHKTAHSDQMTVASVQSDAVAIDTKETTVSITRQAPISEAEAEE